MVSSISSREPRLHAADQDAIDPSLNEHVIYVASDPAHRAMLQVTTFYPDGDGPFPLAIINHSKAVGDPKNEPRYRSIFLSRYFLSRGYAVALPMMRGFAGSGGVFHIQRRDHYRSGVYLRAWRARAPMAFGAP